jgi:hypothetical protein
MIDTGTDVKITSVRIIDSAVTGGWRLASLGGGVEFQGDVRWESERGCGLHSRMVPNRHALVEYGWDGLLPSGSGRTLSALFPPEARGRGNSRLPQERPRNLAGLAATSADHVRPAFHQTTCWGWTEASRVPATA